MASLICDACLRMNSETVQALLGRLIRCGKLALLLLLFFHTSVQAGTNKLSYEDQALILDGKRRAVSVPKGYRLELLARMDSPRMLTFSANGDLFAGSRSGKVYRLPPPYTKAEILVEMGNYPHSVAFRHGEILIAHTDGVYRAEQLHPQDLQTVCSARGFPLTLRMRDGSTVVYQTGKVHDRRAATGLNRGSTGE